LSPVASCGNSYTDHGLRFLFAKPPGGSFVTTANATYLHSSSSLVTYLPHFHPHPSFSFLNPLRTRARNSLFLILLLYLRDQRSVSRTRYVQSPIVFKINGFVIVVTLLYWAKCQVNVCWNVCRNYICTIHLI